ncbi:MAG: hypothetical protein AB7G87_14045 [Clostridia bacterium]
MIFRADIPKSLDLLGLIFLMYVISVPLDYYFHRKESKENRVKALSFYRYYLTKYKIKKYIKSLHPALASFEKQRMIEYSLSLINTMSFTHYLELVLLAEIKELDRYLWHLEYEPPFSDGMKWFQVYSNTLDDRGVPKSVIKTKTDAYRSLLISGYHRWNEKI